MNYNDLTTEELWDFIDGNRYPLPFKTVKNTMTLLNNPQNEFKSIHIAGTNGKGSTTNTLKDILLLSNKKVGMFTSPHILHPRERMKINNESITDEDFRPIALEVIELLEKNNKHIKTPYYGGLYAMIAYTWFARNEVDIAVIEVGVGGRYDATNTITPLISIITNIELDHTDLLGQNYHEIAFQKGGIIKEKIPCILGSKNESVIKMIELISDELKSPLYKVQYNFDSLFTGIKNNKQQMTYISRYNKYENIEMNLNGLYQCDNMALVIKACELLNDKYQFNITENNIRKVISETIWEGRFEYLTDNIVIDGAHNVIGVNELINTLKTKNENKDKFTFLYGNIKTKNYKEMIAILNENEKLIDKIFITEIEGDKKLDSNELNDLCTLNKEIEKSVVKAFNKAKEHSQQTNTKLIICGSLYLMAIIKKLLNEKIISL